MVRGSVTFLRLLLLNHCHTPYFRPLSTPGKSGVERVGRGWGGAPLYSVHYSVEREKYIFFLSQLCRPTQHYCHGRHEITRKLESETWLIARRVQCDVTRSRNYATTYLRGMRIDAFKNYLHFNNMRTSK